MTKEGGDDVDKQQVSFPGSSVIINHGDYLDQESYSLHLSLADDKLQRETIISTTSVQFSSVQFSLSVVSDSL